MNTSGFEILKGDALTYVERVRTILMALDEFYEPYEAIRWFNSPQSLLNNARPAEMLLTDGGWTAVTEQIARLRDGAYV